MKLFELIDKHKKNVVKKVKNLNAWESEETGKFKMLQLENRHIVSLTGLFKVAENHSKIVKLELSSNRIETLAGIEALKDTLLEFDVSMNQVGSVLKVGIKTSD